MKKLIYAGIGSRETPTKVLEFMENVGKTLSERGMILRSGHAGGADLAFEEGSDRANPQNKEIWIPWKNFNGSNSNFIVTSPEAFDMAAQYHPAWDRCSNGARKLHARNMHQILGVDLKTPCNFVICYTKNGLLSGGTAQAIRVAKKHNIPIFNIGKWDKKDVSMKEIEINLYDFIENINKLLGE